MEKRETEFVVASAPMRRVLDQLDRVAALDTTVLLTGESGTGKEVAARHLARNHPRRRRGPLVAVHCGAITESLIESELFGHVKGAFTGADRDRIGKFEQANGGTLFLDEISTMTPEAQIRLLRVLQDRVVTPVGSTENRPVDVRVVVATNTDLRKRVEDGTFRLDLFYRLSTFPVEIPPLRERPGDVLPLLEVLCDRVASRLGLEPAATFSPGAIRCLSEYGWPGNVRELENAIEYALIQSRGSASIEITDLPSEIAGVDARRSSRLANPVVTTDGISLRSAVTNLERELILQSLRLSEGNKARAAELLELKRTTFLEKLRRLEQEGSIPTGYPERSRDEAAVRYAS